MKKILFVYPEMMVGGSTTALLSLLNALPSEKYEVDLQLFRNRGVLLDELPPNITLLPQAEKYTGAMGMFIKMIKFIFTGYLFRSFFRGISGSHKKMISRGIVGDFQTIYLSKKNEKQYDYAIGFLEGWSDRYVAFQAKATVKYAWLHSTFSNITSEPAEEIRWMRRISKIVFVADSCRIDFNKCLPLMAEKTITIQNLFDSEIIRKRSKKIDEADKVLTNYLLSDSFKIVTVCRLTISVKGLDRIVKCASFLRKSGYRFLWYIIGDGDDCESLEKLIRDAGAEDYLILTGKRNNPYPFISAADIMCMPSRYEGKPMTVTESMILGVPPVVTKYLSAEEQINNGVDGIIVENIDDSIISAVENCLSNVSVVASMKKNLALKDYGNMFYYNELEEILFCENREHIKSQAQN